MKSVVYIRGTVQWSALKCDQAGIESVPTRHLPRSKAARMLDVDRELALPVHAAKQFATGEAR